MTNSIGWTIVSNWLDIPASTDVGSFSYANLNIQQWINYTATTTG